MIKIGIGIFLLIAFVKNEYNKIFFYGSKELSQTNIKNPIVKNANSAICTV